MCAVTVNLCSHKMVEDRRTYSFFVLAIYHLRGRNFKPLVPLLEDVIVLCQRLLIFSNSEDMVVQLVKGASAVLVLCIQFPSWYLSTCSVHIPISWAMTLMELK